MSHRINPHEYGASKHIVEAGYLRDLHRDLEDDYYQTIRINPGRVHGDITAERLAEWTLIHRQAFYHCQGFGSQGFSQDMHAADIERIDLLLDKVKRGIEAGDSAKYVNTELLEEFEQIIDAFAVCSDQYKWH